MENKVKSEVPKTGDSDHFVLWAGLMVMAMIGVLSMGIFSAKKRSLFGDHGRHMRK